MREASDDQFDSREDTGYTALGGPDRRWAAALRLAERDLDAPRAGALSAVVGVVVIGASVALGVWAVARIVSGEPRPRPDLAAVALLVALVVPVAVGAAVAVRRRLFVPGWRRASGALTWSERRDLRGAIRHGQRIEPDRMPVAVAEARASVRQLSGVAWVAPGAAFVAGAVAVLVLATDGLDLDHRGHVGLVTYAAMVPVAGAWFVHEYLAGRRYLQDLERGELEDRA